MVHGFRHAMRDRLRAVECPVDMVDKLVDGLTRQSVNAMEVVILLLI